MRTAIYICLLVLLGSFKPIEQSIGGTYLQYTNGVSYSRYMLMDNGMFKAEFGCDECQTIVMYGSWWQQDSLVMIKDTMKSIINRPLSSKADTLLIPGSNTDTLVLHNERGKYYLCKPHSVLKPLLDHFPDWKMEDLCLQKQ